MGKAGPGRVEGFAMREAMMAQQGYLIITDITGYTGFLTQAELEHAQGILADLFKALLGSMKPPFVIAKLEGDAIFAYSPPGGFIQAQTLIEAIEGVYFAFKRQQEIIQLNTTCTCTACRLIPTLDLKFAVHHGSYLVQQLGPSRELTGADVILIHRLLKNTVVETTGVKAYAFFTAAAAEAIDLGELCDEMIPHTERYEHIGEVHGYVSICGPRWHTERNKTASRSRQTGRGSSSPTSTRSRPRCCGTTLSSRHGGRRSWESTG